MNDKEITSKIKKFIIDFGPQRASELSRRFKNFGAQVNKSIINKLLYNKRNEFIRNEVTYRYDVNKSTIHSDVKTQRYQLEADDGDKALDNKFDDIASDFITNYITYQSYFNIPVEKRIEYRHDLINAKSDLETSNRILVDFIINSNYPLCSVKESNFISSETYQLIIQDDKIKNWVQAKQDANEIINLSDEEKYKEYEVLAIKAWEDGIITQEEEIELTTLQSTLGLGSSIANEIFVRVQSEYLAKKQESENRDNTLPTIQINNTTYFVKIRKLAFQKLCNHEFDYQTNKNYLIVNSAHVLYSDSNKEVIYKILGAMYYSKSEMTSQILEQYIERVLANIDIVESI